MTGVQGGLLLILSLMTGICAQAAPATSPEIVVAVRSWQKNLDELDKRLDQPNPDDSRLDVWQKSLDDLRLTIRIAADKAEPETNLIRDDLQALGKPPGPNEPPESTSVAVRRQSLNQQLAQVEGGIKEAELVINRADRLATEISDLRRSRFTHRLLTPGPWPLASSVWVQAGNQWGTVVDTLQKHGQQLSLRDEYPHAVSRLIWILVLAAGLGLALRQVLRHTWVQPVDAHPFRLSRYLSVIRLSAFHALLPTAPLFSLVVVLMMDPFWEGPLVEQLIPATLFLVAAVTVAIVARIAQTGSHPPIPAWLLTALVISFGIDCMTTKTLSLVEDASDLLLLERLGFAWVVPGLLFGLLRCLWVAQPNTVLGRVLGVSLLLIPLAGLAGYVALAQLMTIQWLMTAGLIQITRELLILAEESMEWFFAADSATGIRLRQTLALSEEGCELVQFWSHELIRLVTLTLAGIGFLLLWGVGTSHLATWLYQAFFGFRIGSLSFSLANLLWASVLLIGLLTGTRLLQRTLDTRIFPKTRWDTGIRHSIRSALGYLGFTLAVVSALGSLGLDLSNLAIIAGALSVGIGFGMQNIVNNFVSGLILLVERPIKVGDWVVVGDYQGYVRKISVRATEITTFDRASVFIPNSSLISGNVMNRTHADKVGRILLPLGVPYGVDAKRLRSLLLEIAESHPEIRRNPAPSVVLRGFGENSLNFELFAFVNDVDNVMLVTSDLCFEIDALLRTEGIEFPRYQREIKLTLETEQAVRHSTVM
ncbi:MAG: DUF3772 domain-containing protein [Methylococcaceae bacterium]